VIEEPLGDFSKPGWKSYRDFLLWMSSGREYRLELSVPHSTPWLAIEDVDGKLLKEQGDGFGQRRVEIVFRPEVDGLYRLIPSWAWAPASGNYILSISSDSFAE
jgi:hypothetical protein